jgi:hypothetical protein
MQDPNPGQSASGVRIAVLAGFVVALMGCGIAGVIAFAEGGELPSFIEDSLDVIVRALPDNVGWVELIGWFLVAEGAFWLLAAAVYMAVKLPGIEDGLEAEALRERLRANLSTAENAAAREDLGNLKTKVVKRAFTFAAMGAGSWFFAWILLGGVFNF